MLHLAAAKGHASAVEALLAPGAELGAEVKDGSQALHLAARNGHASAVAALLAAGAVLVG